MIFFGTVIDNFSAANEANLVHDVQSIALTFVYLGLGTLFVSYLQVPRPRLAVRS